MKIKKFNLEKTLSMAEEKEKKPESTEAPKDSKNQQAETTPKEPVGKGKKVLVVDDEEGTVKLIKGLLTNEGFEVLVAVNGQEGLNRATNEKPDVIVVDVLMPEMDGFSLFKELKNADTAKTIPVLIITARKNMEETFLAMKADGFMAKPIVAEEFLKTVITLANQPKKKAEKPEGEAKKPEEKPKEEEKPK